MALASLQREPRARLQPRPEPERRQAPQPGGDRLAYLGEQALEVASQLQTDFAERDRLYRDGIDPVLWSTYTIQIPEAYKATTSVIKSPLQFQTAAIVSASIGINPQQVHFEPVGESQRAQQNSELREHFFEASWRRQERDAGRQLLRLFLWNLVVYGEGVLKTIEQSARAWGGSEGYSAYATRRRGETDDDAEYDRDTERYKRDRAPYPLASTEVPPADFYYWRGIGGGFTVCAEVNELPYLEALERFGAGLDGNGHVTRYGALGLPRSQYDAAMAGVNTITCTEVWTAGGKGEGGRGQPPRVVYVLAGPGQVAKARPGARGGRIDVAGTAVKSLPAWGYADTTTGTLRGPYFHALGTTTGSRRPDRAGVGILRPFLPLYQSLDNLLTAQANSAWQTSFATYKRNQPPAGAQAGILGGPAQAPFGLDGREQNALAGETQVIQPGTIYPYDIGPLEQPHAGLDVDKIIVQIRDFLKLALPDAVSGGGGSSSGYELNQKSHQARIAWDPLVSNAQVALADRVAFESWAIEHLVGERVQAFGDLPDGKRRPRRRLFASLKPKVAGWLAVGPEELNGSHRYTVTLDPDVPTDRILEVRTHAELTAAGFESQAEAIEHLGGDPAETERELLIQNTKRSPMVQQPLQQRIAQRLGLHDAQLLAKIGAGPDGTPMFPGAAPPGAPGAAAMGPPGAGGPGGPGIGLPPGLPDANAPGFGMPLIPTASNPGGAGTPGGFPGGIPGMPVVPGPPAAHLPLAGQGAGVAQP